MCRVLTPPPPPLLEEWASLYPYTTDLLYLDCCQATMPPSHPDLLPTHTPLDQGAWELVLWQHPDRAFVRFLLTGLQTGFRIGFRRPSPLQLASRNMHSALLHPEVVQEYL